MTESEEIEKLRAALDQIGKILARAVKRVTRSRDKIPYAEIADLYHQILPFGSACRKLTAKRKTAIAARWNSGDLPDLETWREYFERAAKAKGIRNGIPAHDGFKAFQVSIDYLIREDSYAKALENTGAFKW